MLTGIGICNFVLSCRTICQEAQKERMEEELFRKPYASNMHPLNSVDVSKGGRAQSKMTPITTPRAAVGLGRQERFIPSWYNPSIAATTPSIYGTTTNSKV